MAWIESKLDRSIPRPGFDTYKSKHNVAKDSAEYQDWRKVWSDSQKILIQNASTFYMRMAVASTAEDFYKKAAGLVGLALSKKAGEYPDDTAKGLDTLVQYKLGGEGENAIACGIACQANGEVGGHAVALYQDDDDRVHFFDPNFGEFLIHEGKVFAFFDNCVEKVLLGRLKWKLQGVFGFFVTTQPV